MHGRTILIVTYFGAWKGNLNQGSGMVFSSNQHV